VDADKIIAVIGGGSAGFTAARTAARLGARVLFFMGNQASRKPRRSTADNGNDLVGVHSLRPPFREAPPSIRIHICAKSIARLDPTTRHGEPVRRFRLSGRWLSKPRSRLPFP